MKRDTSRRTLDMSCKFIKTHLLSLQGINLTEADSDGREGF